MSQFSLFRRLFGRFASNDSSAEASDSYDKAKQLWGDNAAALVRKSLPSSWAECPFVLQEYINPLVSRSNPPKDWLSSIANTYFPEPVPRALSLGCGSGGLERHGLDLKITEQFDALDFSPQAIEVAKKEAKKLFGSRNINYQVADLNQPSLDAEFYDAVFASQSVHHIENLEGYVSEVHKTLKPGGLFIVNEYIGPNQFQWTDVQYETAQQMLLDIPVHYRAMIREEGTKEKVGRPTIEEMNAYDPTEAIRSEDIVPQLEQHFEVIDRRDFGGTLLHLVLDNIAGNLSQDDEGKTILRNMFADEQRLIAAGEIQSDFTVIVARKSV